MLTTHNHRFVSKSPVTELYGLTAQANDPEPRVDCECGVYVVYGNSTPTWHSADGTIITPETGE